MSEVRFFMGRVELGWHVLASCDFVCESVTLTNFWDKRSQFRQHVIKRWSSRKCVGWLLVVEFWDEPAIVAGRTEGGSRGNGGMILEDNGRVGTKRDEVVANCYWNLTEPSTEIWCCNTALSGRKWTSYNQRWLQRPSDDKENLKGLGSGSLATPNGRALRQTAHFILVYYRL